MSPFVIAFSISLLAYMCVMYAIGYWAQRRVTTVDDYVLAGRSLPVSLTTITMITTWFGAESLMTTTDEVAHAGWRGALLDPIGIALCLVITGGLVAKPMWRMNLLTIPDFFRQRYGQRAETLVSLVLVPSYFGWIAAQYLALATILTQLYGLSLNHWIVIVAIAGTGYALMGGMLSITWTDTLQLGFILLGLVVLGYQILMTLGDGSLVAGWLRARHQSPVEHWLLTRPETFWPDVLAALSVLAIGALGNLPVQDLMQRIFSARSAEVAQAACFWAAGGYLLMGLLPIGTGLTASLLLHQVPEEGILTAVAGRILSAPLQIIFLLAIISAVLSTIVSAVMAPAAVLAHNLVEPLAARRWGKLSSAQALLLQRGAVVTIASASVLLALSGRGAFELVQDAYAMSLVGMFVPFVAGILCSRVPAAGASCALLVGTSCWLWHVLMGWEFFGGPALAGVIAVPHELADTLLSGIAFCACLLPPFSRRASGLES